MFGTAQLTDDLVAAAIRGCPDDASRIMEMISPQVRLMVTARLSPNPGQFHAVEELGEQGFTLESLLQYERNADRDVTFTNVAVALAFLRERGILDVRYRRNYAATQCAHLDAMTEFHALAENG